MERRVVVTGIGLVTPVGIGRDETWNALVAGQSGIGPITLFNITDFATKFAGEVKNWEPTRWIEKRDAKTYDRFLQFGRINLNALIVTADDHLQSKLGHLPNLLFNGHLLQQAFDLLRVITRRPTRTNRGLKKLFAVVNVRRAYSVLTRAHA